MGQLGNSQATGDVITPGAVPALSNIAEITCGDQYACAVSESGVLKCWGINFRNVLGIASNPAKLDGPAIPSAAKYGVSGATVYNVAGGVYHTCLVTNGGGVFCVGWNNAGQVCTFVFGCVSVIWVSFDINEIACYHAIVYNMGVVIGVDRWTLKNVKKVAYHWILYLYMPYHILFRILTL
jgi:hypothetical protein